MNPFPLFFPSYTYESCPSAHLTACIGKTFLKCSAPFFFCLNSCPGIPVLIAAIETQACPFTGSTPLDPVPRPSHLPVRLFIEMGFYDEASCVATPL